MIINESQSTEQHPHLPIGCSVHGGGSPCVPLYRCQFCARGYPASEPWPISCRSVFWLLLCSCKKHFAEYTILVVYNSTQKSINSLEKHITPYYSRVYARGNLHI